MLKRMRANGHSCAIGAAIAVALACAGCSQMAGYPDLPPLVKDERKLLTKAEQERAITEISLRKDAEKAEALRQIEKAK